MADDLLSIEREIAAIQKNEEKIERVLAFQRIVSAYRTVKAFVDQLPPSVANSLPTSGISLQPHGFLLDDLVLNIDDNESLTVLKNGNEVGSGASFFLPLSKRVTAAAAEFIDTTKKKIAEEKEKLMEKLRDF